MNKQAIVIRYIRENYLDFGRIRHDVVSDKLQIRDEHSLEPFRMVQNGSAVVQNGSESWREMTRQDINSIVCQCAQEYDANISYREVITALQSDLIPNVHPLREYIQSLKPYTNDQPDWIDMVASQVRIKTNNNEDTLIQHPKQQITNNIPLANTASGEENNTTPSDTTLHDTTPNAKGLWRVCFKKWFVAMVASWMHDEVVNHQVLVLIGKQGIYKTTWLEHLIPPELRQYCCKMSNAGDLNKDERLRVAEFGLINMDEIDALNTRELNQLKSLITTSDVNERAPYAYSKERRIRLASFCASGNRKDFLSDVTGNRRWLPFEVESIQNPFFTTLPYEQMYAEAWALAQDSTYNYWFELDEIAVLEQHNEYFLDEGNEAQLLMVYFAVPAQDSPNAKFLTTAEISEKLVTYGNIKHPMSLKQLGNVMSSKKFIGDRRGTPARRGWIVYERDSEEINAERRRLAQTSIANIADTF